MKTYLVFIVYVYQQQDKQGNFINSTECQIVAKDRAEAEKKALAAINDPVKKNVHIKMIVEKVV